MCENVWEHVGSVCACRQIQLFTWQLDSGTWFARRGGEGESHFQQRNTWTPSHQWPSKGEVERRRGKKRQGDGRGRGKVWGGRGHIQYLEQNTGRMIGTSMSKGKGSPSILSSLSKYCKKEVHHDLWPLTPQFFYFRNSTRQPTDMVPISLVPRVPPRAWVRG